MKIDDYKIGTSFVINCAKTKRKYGLKELDEYVYDSFGITKKHANIYGREPEDIVKVKCTIIEEDVILQDLLKNKEYDTNSVDYFGWISFEDDELNISMIYRNIKIYSVCFPYGADAGRFWSNDIRNIETNEIEHHKGDRRGMTVRLKIEEIN